MSMFVNENGSLKTYAVVDTRAETVLATFNYVGEADKGMKALIKDGAGDLALHNITHPKCPDWLQDLIRSDSEYCSRKAADLDARAASLRRKAAAIVEEAEGYEGRAAKWRELAEAASAPSGPGM